MQIGRLYSDKGFGWWNHRNAFVASLTLACWAHILGCRFHLCAWVVDVYIRTWARDSDVCHIMWHVYVMISRPTIWSHVEPDSHPDAPHYWHGWWADLFNECACVCLGTLLKRVFSLPSMPTKSKKYWQKKSKNSSKKDGVCLLHNHLLEIILCEQYQKCIFRWDP